MVATKTTKGNEAQEKDADNDLSKQNPKAGLASSSVKEASSASVEVNSALF